jgi:hypothetical protein
MNTKIKELIDQMEKYGQPALNEFFSLNRKEIKEKIRDIIGESWFDEHCSGMIEHGTVIKMTSNDVPEKIEIYYYDKIEITQFGIYFHPEHGDRKILRNFDKYFTHIVDERPREKCVFFDPCQGRNKCTSPSLNLKSPMECTKICDNYKKI